MGARTHYLEALLSIIAPCDRQLICRRGGTTPRSLRQAGDSVRISTSAGKGKRLDYPRGSRMAIRGGDWRRFWVISSTCKQLQQLDRQLQLLGSRTVARSASSADETEGSSDVRAVEFVNTTTISVEHGSEYFAHPKFCDFLARSLAYEILRQIMATRICDEVDSKLRLQIKSKKLHRLATNSWVLLD